MKHASESPEEMLWRWEKIHKQWDPTVIQGSMVRDMNGTLGTQHQAVEKPHEVFGRIAAARKRKRGVNEEERM